MGKPHDDEPDTIAPTESDATATSPPVETGPDPVLPSSDATAEAAPLDVA